ncbi:MAG TPA: DNA gyrase subunit A [Atribacteraceae bacterium]|nr:DNA gyrase subunit A [Atribacteraceae bacterium]
MSDEKGKVVPVDVTEEMRQSYLSYAMSVIVGRALPDARDGLKPVQRRILFAMNEMGLRSQEPHKKSARVVGDVLGKYHPHGDMAVYDALVRMAQEFTYRYPLVDGHGNFGSVDGDPPAAMRYTEVRMAQISNELLTDIDKETVEFIPNFDESLNEPQVLPAAFPQLLSNGSSGIAVGMATNIPPHNLAELVDATIFLINHPQTSWRELINIMPGPDFPTYGKIVGGKGILDYFEKGRGKLVLRGEAQVEDIGKSRQGIVIRELPYQVNKATLVQSIAHLIQNKKITDVAEVRDESDRDGMRIVLELKKGANPQFIINYLYKHTTLQVSFGVILLALVDNRPEVMGVAEALRHFIGFRKEVVTRRSRFELRENEERAHILEGFLRALDQVGQIIATIRSSQTVQEARSRLMSEFDFSEKQAQAILDMRLQRLVALERKKILEEHEVLLRKIEELRDILSREESLLRVVKKELVEVKRKHGDGRRTRIIPEEGSVEDLDLIPEEDIVLTLTRGGYIKRVSLTQYRRQGRGGRGVSGITTKEEDVVRQIAVATTLHRLLLFTSKGRVFQIPAYQLPERERQSRGNHLANLLALEEGEQVFRFIPLKDFGQGRHLFFVTTRGVVKKSDLLEFVSITRRGIRAINLDADDRLSAVFVTDGSNEVFLATVRGLALSFPETEVRSMGRDTRGVRGISLKEGDRVVSACILDRTRPLLVVSARGMGKKLSLADFASHHRGSRGVIIMKGAGDTGEVVSVSTLDENNEVLISTRAGLLIRIDTRDVPLLGRPTRGVKLIRLGSGDLISSVAMVDISPVAMVDS